MPEHFNVEAAGIAERIAERKRHLVEKSLPKARAVVERLEEMAADGPSSLHSCFPHGAADAHTREWAEEITTGEPPHRPNTYNPDPPMGEHPDVEAVKRAAAASGGELRPGEGRAPEAHETGSLGPYSVDPRHGNLDGGPWSRFMRRTENYNAAAQLAGEPAADFWSDWQGSTSWWLNYTGLLDDGDTVPIDDLLDDEPDVYPDGGGFDRTGAHSGPANGDTTTWPDEWEATRRAETPPAVGLLERILDQSRLQTGLMRRIIDLLSDQVVERRRQTDHLAEIDDKLRTIEQRGRL